MQAKLVDACAGMLIVFVNVFSLGLTFMAQYQWNLGGRSRKLTIAAWIIFSAAPFIASFVPAKLFVNWEPAAESLDAYSREAEIHLGVNNTIQQIEEKCEITRVEGDSKLESAKKSIDNVCGVVNWLP